MRFILLLLFNLFFSFTAYSQLIVNVENSRIQSDTTGWKGDFGTSLGLTKNVQQIISINATAHLQYKTAKNLYLFIGNYNYLRGNNEELANNMFYHLRFNRKLTEAVSWEVFNQWQQNSITNIDLRVLAGTGPRFRVLKNKKLRVYAGTLAMYEYEVNKNPRIILNDARSSNYLSVTYKPNDLFDVTSTTFYQPLFRRFKDYRILNQVTLNFKATKRLSFSLNWDYSYDSFPAEGTPLINYTLTNGFNYTF